MKQGWEREKVASHEELHFPLYGLVDEMKMARQEKKQSMMIESTGSLSNTLCYLLCFSLLSLPTDTNTILVSVFSEE